MICPEGPSDRIDTCGSDVAAHLAGGGIRFGTQATDPDPGDTSIRYCPFAVHAATAGPTTTAPAGAISPPRANAPHPGLSPRHAARDRFCRFQSLHQMGLRGRSRTSA